VLAAAETGPTRVIVELRLADAFIREGELTEQGVRGQRAAIDAAQESLLAELDAADARLIRRPESAPFLALEITLGGLGKLQAMPEQVIRVYADRTGETQ
jgi:hypothetical protein